MTEQSFCFWTRKALMSLLAFKSVTPLVRLEQEGKLNPVRFGRSIRYRGDEVMKLSGQDIKDHTSDYSPEAWQ